MNNQLKYVQEQLAYHYLPNHIKNDIEKQKCPIEVAYALIDLLTDTYALWGRRKARDWVSRAYKRAKKSCNYKEMLKYIEKYLAARGYDEIKDTWYAYSVEKKLYNGKVYILERYDKPGLLKVGMVRNRKVETRALEIENQTDHLWDVVYWRYTIDVKTAEFRVHNQLPNRIHPRREFFNVSPKKAIAIIDRTIDILEEQKAIMFDWYVRDIRNKT